MKSARPVESTMMSEPVRTLPMPTDRAVRIGLCTDTHYWPGGSIQKGSGGSLQLLYASGWLLSTLLTELAAAQLDLALHLGDLTCGGGLFEMPPAAFYGALEEGRQAFAALPAPCFALPGNHDCPPGGGVWSYFTRQWGLSPGIGTTIDLPAARLILLNAQGHSALQIEAARPEDPVSGWVSEAELARLDTALAGADGRPVLLFVHQLLQPWSGDQPWKEFYAVENRRQVLALLARHGNVRAVFQGHAHRFDVQTVPLGGQPCTFIVAPAVIEHPLAWLLIELSPDRLRVTLRQLPLPDLLAPSQDGGPDQSWRAGQPAWRDMTIHLRKD